MGKGMNEVVPDMAHGKPVRVRLLSAGGTKPVVGRDHCSAVQAVSGVHVT